MLAEIKTSPGIIWGIICCIIPSLVIAGQCDLYEAASDVSPGVFAVMDGGKFEINDGNANHFSTKNDVCHINFTGSTSINVGNSNYYPPRKSGCGVTATDTTVGKLALPTFLTSSVTRDIRMINQSARTQVHDRTYEATETDSSHAGKDEYCHNRKSNQCATGYLAMTFPVLVDDSQPYLLMSNRVYNEWDLIQANAASPYDLYFSYDPSDQPYIFNKLSVGHTHRVIFEPGTYFINEFEWDQDTVLEVKTKDDAGTPLGDGSGVAKIHILDGNGSNFRGHGVCINVDGCIKGNPSARSSIQHPERLNFYVHTGNLHFSDNLQISAGIYINDGSLSITANSGTVFIGEAVAQNISVGNKSGVEFEYQDTHMFSDLYSSGSVVEPITKEGFYSLAAPAIPSSAMTSDLIYIPYQTDDTSNNGGTGITGHIMAFPLTDSGTSATTPVWDANEEMLAWERRSRLFSTDSSGNLKRLRDMGSSDFQSTDPSYSTIINYTVDPNHASGRYLGGRDSSSMMGTPHTTQPVIMDFANIVVFHSDDGFVYGVDQDTGDLKWGFMPRPLLTQLKDYDTFYTTHSMQGQLSAIGDTDSIGYVVGSAQSGSLHYALRIGNDGKIKKQSWLDQTPGTNASRPVIFQLANKLHTLYIKNKTSVVVRSLEHAGYTEKIYDLSAQVGEITSAPTLYESFDLSGNNRNQNISLYIGDANGNVYETPLVKSGGLSFSLKLTTVGNIGTSSDVTDPVLFVQTATLGGYDVITAQTETRLKTFTRSENGVLESDWTSYVSGSGQWQSGRYRAESGYSKPKSEHIQLLESNITITDQVEIAESVVFLPVQEETESSCNALYYLYNLDDGYFPLTTLHRKSPVVDNIQIGTGLAFKPTIISLNGETTVQGHSEKNNTEKLGIDNPFQFSQSSQGVLDWRELTDD